MTGQARPDLGQVVTGIVADENDWAKAGPRIITPRRTVTGIVTGLFMLCPSAATIRTDAGETVCVRVTAIVRASPR